MYLTVRSTSLYNKVVVLPTWCNFFVFHILGIRISHYNILTSHTLVDSPLKNLLMLAAAVLIAVARTGGHVGQIKPSVPARVTMMTPNNKYVLEKTEVDTEYEEQSRKLRGFGQHVRTVLPDVSLLAAGMTTWTINNVAGVPAISSGSLVGLVSGLILPQTLALAAICGCFAGMAKVQVIPSLAAAAAMCVLSALLLRAANRFQLFVGCGGRLGFVAQVACTITFLSMRIAPVTRCASLAGASVFCLRNYAKMQLLALPAICLGSVLGAIATRGWQNAFALSPRLANGVTASSATGVLASILLPSSMHAPAYAGALVAMSSKQVLPSNFHLILAAILCGLAQVLLTGVLNGGWAGKLGTCALLGVIMAKALPMGKEQ